MAGKKFFLVSLMLEYFNVIAFLDSNLETFCKEFDDRIRPLKSYFFRHMSGDENEDLLRAMKFSKAKKRKAL